MNLQYGNRQSFAVCLPANGPFVKYFLAPGASISKSFNISLTYEFYFNRLNEKEGIFHAPVSKRGKLL